MEVIFYPKSLIPRKALKLFNFKVMKNVVGTDGRQLYDEFNNVLKDRYNTLAPKKNDIGSYIKKLKIKARPTFTQGGVNQIVYSILSNKENDFFSATDLFLTILKQNLTSKIANMYILTSLVWR
ncbi:MAG: hypothetical protein Ct9H90mP7_0120 [Candidatus Neomarinimicrobiota bacterium]|nr:MAG: hypothetical protein Ct9H90mP7_0120 [Candidatus Neomarinimicrobiota bacterium]